MSGAGWCHRCHRDPVPLVGETGMCDPCCWARMRHGAQRVHWVMFDARPYGGFEPRVWALADSRRGWLGSIQLSKFGPARYVATSTVGQYPLVCHTLLQAARYLLSAWGIKQ